MVRSVEPRNFVGSYNINSDQNIHEPSLQAQQSEKTFVPPADRGTINRLASHIKSILASAMELKSKKSTPPIAAEHLVGKDALIMFYQRAPESWVTGPAQAGVAMAAATAAVAAATVQAVATLAAARGGVMEVSRPLFLENVDIKKLSIEQLVSMREAQI